MSLVVITERDAARRSYWIDEISRLSGDFGIDAERVERAISQEIGDQGIPALLGHLRLCGVIPERYRPGSSEEKLYSKYTDIVIHEAYRSLGCTSLVLKERADVADVECVCGRFSFVADAKAFRLSRTAKNQKDFKVQAMDNWKHGKPFAMLVCPVYQLPSRTSQIYQQAAARSVCVFTYTHLAVLVRYAELVGEERSVALLHEIFKTVAAMNPSKSASAYWQAVNRTLLDYDARMSDIWREEKLASIEAIRLAQDESLQFLASERERIMRLSREDAIREVIRSHKIDKRIRAVRSVADNGLLEIV